MIEYELDKDRTIIGHIMPDFIKGSFVNEFIRHHALSMFDIYMKMYQKQGGEELDELKQLDIEKYCLQKAGTMLAELIKRNPCPGEVVNLLSSDLKKKDQIKLLRGVSIKAEHFASIFQKAEELGYTMSSIRYEGEPKNISHEKLPKFAYLDEEGNVEKVGGETLSDGQVKALIEEAHVLIARIAEKDGHWHCFVQTFRGLKGKESGQQGSRSHIHYLSDKFVNLTFEDLVSMLEQGNYPTTPVHIPLNS